MKLSFFYILILLFVPFSSRAIDLSHFEDGAAITHPRLVRSLENRGLGIGAFLTNRSNAMTVVSNKDLLQESEAFLMVVTDLEKEFQNYQDNNPGSGVGMDFAQRLFDPYYLKSSKARFSLIGVINRMDRGFQGLSPCGETRLIYRLAYRVNSYGYEVYSRLPMTLNLVFENPQDLAQCQTLAQNWVKMDLKNQKTVTDALNALTSQSGPADLAFFTKKNLLRLELNLQIARWPSGTRPDFGGNAEYLFKVYKWLPDQNTFSELPLENQIDRDKLQKSEKFLQEFKDWILQKENFKALDQGTLVIPEKFLATSAISVAPAGFMRAKNSPIYGLFAENDLKSNIPKSSLTTIKSIQGFRNRMDGLSCTGCHQTRGIAGFHFIGADPDQKYPGNSVYSPGSAHFFGDLVRRKNIISAIANGNVIDFSKGFAARPLTKDSQGIAGTGLVNGWGATCHVGHDPSFVDWNCGPNLQCQVLYESDNNPNMGICLSKNKNEIGEPIEFGTIQTKDFNTDIYKLKKLTDLSDPENIYVASPQSFMAGSSTGGFPGGNIRTKDCSNLPPHAACGALPAAKSGFNACVAKAKNFIECINEFKAGVGLRACDSLTPCRDDYICSESYEANQGVCVPPYFLFQFRVDGHPLKHGS